MNFKNYKRSLLALSITTALLVGSFDSYAEKADIEFAGFASFVYAKTITDDKKEDTFMGMSNNGEYRDFNNLGLRMTADMHDNLTFTAQVIAEGATDYQPTFDWIFATYAINSEYSVSVGKVRVPVFMYSDYLDTSYAYQWIKPPRVVYDSQQTPFKSMEGIKFAYNTQISDWNSEVLFWGGKAEDDFKVQGIDSSLILNDALGLAWTVDREWLTLRAFYFDANVSVDVLTNPNLFGLINGTQEGDSSLAALMAAIANPDPTAFPAALQAAGLIEGTEELGSALLGKSVYLQNVRDSILVDDDNGQFYGVGASMDFGQYFIVSEITEINSDANIVLPNLLSAYVMLGMRLPKDWSVAFTYGEDRDRSNKDVWKSVDSYVIANPSTLQEGQYNALIQGVRDTLESTTNFLQNYDVKNYTLSTRWDFHRSAALKFEYIIQDYTVDFDNSTNLNPHAIRLGLDLVF